MKALDLSREANWRKRFRASEIVWAAVAHLNPQRGLVCTNKDGIYQLYAWNIPGNELRQLTYEPAGVLLGTIRDEDHELIAAPAKHVVRSRR